MTADLFQRVGGRETIARMVLDFYDRVLATEELAPYFAGVDMRRLVEHQAKFISTALGGPAIYSDQDLREIHAHLSVEEEAFDRLVDLFEQTASEHVRDAVDLERVVSVLRRRRPFITGLSA